MEGTESPPRNAEHGRDDIEAVLAEELVVAGAARSIVIESLAGTGGFDALLLKFVGDVPRVFDNSSREEHFLTVVELIIARNDFNRTCKQDLSRLVRFISGYKSEIDDVIVCRRAFIALRVLFRDISTADARAMISDGGKYVRLAYLALSDGKDEEMSKVVAEISVRNLANVQTLVILFENWKFSDLSQVNQRLVENTMKGFVGGLLKEGRKGQLIGISLLGANFNFEVNGVDPSDAVPYIELFGLITTGSDVVKVAIIKLMTKARVGTMALDGDGHLLKTLTVMCRYLTSWKDEYAAAVVEFAMLRAELPLLCDCMPLLLGGDATYYGALLICVRLNMFKKRSRLVINAFPVAVQPKRLICVLQVIDVISENALMDEYVMEVVLNHLLKVSASDGFTRTDEQKKSVIAAIRKLVRAGENCVRCIQQTIAKEIFGVSDCDVLEAFGAGFAELDIQVTEPPNEEAFCFVICHVFAHVKSISCVAHFMRLFIECRDKPQSTNPIELIRSIPSEFTERMMDVAMQKVKENPRLAVMCVTVPGLSDSTLEFLATLVLTADDGFTYNIGIEFLTTLAVHYFPFMLTMLETHKLGSEVTSNILVSKKRRMRAIEAVRAVCAALPDILEGRTLEVSEQKKLWSGICSIIPTVCYNDVKDRVVCLHSVFPYIRDVVPAESQYEIFLRPEFASDVPVFLNRVPQCDSLALACIGLWFEVASRETDLARQSKPMAELIFRLSPKQETLTHALFKIGKRQLPPEEEARQFAYYAQAMVEAARNVGVTLEDVVYIDIFLHFARFTVSSDPALRMASVDMIATVLAVDHIEESQSSLTHDQMVSIYKKLLARASDSFVVLLLRRIVGRVNLYVQHGHLMRAILESRVNVVNEETTPILLQLFKKYSKFPTIVKHHFQRGVLASAMDEMIPLLMESDTSFKRLMFEQCMKCHDTRLLFLSNFRATANRVELVTRSFEVFEYLKKVIVMERSNEVADDTYGFVISVCLMWIGLVSALSPNVNLITLSTQKRAISETIELLFKRVCSEMDDRWIDITLASTQELSIVIARICRLGSYVSADKIMESVRSVIMMLGSPHDEFIINACMFLVHILPSLETYESEKMIEVRMVATKGVMSAFQHGTPQTKLCLAGVAGLVCPDMLLVDIETEDLERMCKATIEGICHGQNKWCKEHAMSLLARMIVAVPSQTITVSTLLLVVHTAFSELSFNVEFLVVLQYLLRFECDRKAFVNGESNVSVLGLAKMIGAYETEIIQVLTVITASEDIVSGLVEMVDTDYLARFGLCIIHDARSNNDVVARLICSVACAVGDSHSAISAEFKKAAVTPLFVMTTRPDLSHLAVAALSAIIT